MNEPLLSPVRCPKCQTRYLAGNWCDFVLVFNRCAMSQVVVWSLRWTAANQAAGRSAEAEASVCGYITPLHHSAGSIRAVRCLSAGKLRVRHMT